MPSTQPLLDALHDKLVAGVGSQVSGRVYDTLGPTDSALPMLVYQVAKHPPDGYFDGADRLNLYLSLESIGPRRSGVKALRLIHDAAFDALHRQALSVAGYHGAQALCLDRGGHVDVRDEAIVMRSSWHLFADPD